MKTSISIASMHDARALADLRGCVARGMTREFGEGHWSPCPSKAEVVRQLRASQILIARRDAEIIGTVRLARVLPGIIDSEAFTKVDTALYVLGLAVAPEVRRQGIGRDLMDAAKESARAWPANALWLDAYDHVAGAGAFYQACGFRAVGSSLKGEIPLIFYEWLPDRPS
jgi:GNAT superfamily N-acetyltransferase